MVSSPNSASPPPPGGNGGVVAGHIVPPSPVQPMEQEEEEAAASSPAADEAAARRLDRDTPELSESMRRRLRKEQEAFDGQDKGKNTSKWHLKEQTKLIRFTPADSPYPQLPPQEDDLQKVADLPAPPNGQPTPQQQHRNNLRLPLQQQQQQQQQQQGAMSYNWQQRHPQRDR